MVPAYTRPQLPRIPRSSPSSVGKRAWSRASTALQLPDLPKAADAAKVVSSLAAMLETNLTAVPEDAPGVPLEFVVIDGDESNGDGNSSDYDSGNEIRIEEDGGGADVGDGFVELQLCALTKKMFRFGT